MDKLACRRKTGCVDFDGVHYYAARDSNCHRAVTGIEVKEVRTVSTKVKYDDRQASSFYSTLSRPIYEHGSRHMPGQDRMLDTCTLLKIGGRAMYAERCSVTPRIFASNFGGVLLGMRGLRAAAGLARSSRLLEDFRDLVEVTVRDALLRQARLMFCSSSAKAKVPAEP